MFQMKTDRTDERKLKKQKSDLAQASTSWINQLEMCLHLENLCGKGECMDS